MGIPSVVETLGIEALTPMQEAMYSEALSPGSVVLLSPTGSGKTLAFLLPLARLLNSGKSELQAVVIVPTRELADQDEAVLRSMKTGLRSMCLHGGRPAMEEHRKMREFRPQVIFATPGRMNDHFDKKNLSGEGIRVWVIDEFDKCLQLGFREEMEKLALSFGKVSHLWLTSATDAREIPDFITKVGTKVNGSALRLNFLQAVDGLQKRTALFQVRSPGKDKLQTLGHLLTYLQGAPAIVFVAHRESVERVEHFLAYEGFAVEAYHGGMEQEWRERALYKFRAGTANVLVSTDLAARGLDIPEVRAVIHYHLPLSEDDFIHRNGRTARWDATGSIFLLLSPEEVLPSFASGAEVLSVPLSDFEPTPPKYVSVYIGRGKLDKLSKVDVVGFFCKKGGLRSQDIGRIDVGSRCAYVAILRSKVDQALRLVAHEKIKGMRTIIERMRK